MWFRAKRPIPESDKQRLIKDAEHLLRAWPDLNHVPGDTLLAAFGLAAYLYIREIELKGKSHD